MANLQAMLHVLLPIEITLAEATGKINDIIYQNTPADKFITFCWGKYYNDSKRFRYVNAGHNHPYWFKAGEDEPEELTSGGLILGAMPSMAPYEEEEIQLSAGDLLVFYTDGVTEAQNRNGSEEFEEDRLLKCIRKYRDGTAEEIKKGIIDEVNAFSGANQSDDITLIIIKVR